MSEKFKISCTYLIIYSSTFIFSFSCTCRLISILNNLDYKVIMTQEELGSVADAYKQIQEAERQADQLEKMLDNLDAKMNSILSEAEKLQKESGKETETKQEKDE